MIGTRLRQWDWVTESGGGLFLLSHAGGDKGRQAFSELAEEYGMVFENDQVLDTKNNVQNLENYLLIDAFVCTSHCSRTH